MDRDSFWNLLWMNTVSSLHKRNTQGTRKCFGPISETHDLAMLGLISLNPCSVWEEQWPIIALPNHHWRPVRWISDIFEICQICQKLSWAMSLTRAFSLSAPAKSDESSWWCISGLKIWRIDLLYKLKTASSPVLSTRTVSGYSTATMNKAAFFCLASMLLINKLASELSKKSLSTTVNRQDSRQRLTGRFHP